MSPFQHGEVFVTEDGSETDLDLGHYERFLKTKMSKDFSFKLSLQQEVSKKKEKLLKIQKDGQMNEIST